MRHPRFGFVVLGLFLFVPAGLAQAQGQGVGSDPFSFYYGYYLPHQAAIAAQPTPLDTINAVTANRQLTAQTNRETLYDPISPYGDDPDLLNPFSQRGRERAAKIQGFASNIRGTGPSTHYSRTERYFPGIRPGRGVNRNVSAGRNSRFGGGGGGFGGGVPSGGSPSVPGGVF